MEKLVLYIKSFRPDFKRVENLLRSIEKHNRDRIPVYVSVNDNDYKFFKNKLGYTVNLLKDSDIVVCKLKDGWRYQQVVKAQLHRLAICENYLCIDSDSEFIRDFFITDFMYDDQTPYTIMHEAKSFLDTMEIIGRDSTDLFQSRALKSVRDTLGTHGKSWDYGPSPYLWSTKVWRHFHDQYLRPRQHTLESFFKELELSAVPSEAIIYGEYLLKTRLIDILPIEGLFKVYHFKEQFEMEEAYYDIERLKKNYMGVIKQSNWNEDLNVADEELRKKPFRFLWFK